MKRWLASQEDTQTILRPIDIDEILIGPDALLELPSVLERAGTARGGRVLLVMDETPMRRAEQDLKPFVQDLLRQAGYASHEVIEAENGREALEKVASQAPDLGRVWWISAGEVA